MGTEGNPTMYSYAQGFAEFVKDKTEVSFYSNSLSITLSLMTNANEDFRVWLNES